MSFTNKIPSYESLLEFQEVYLRAIAMSWHDDKFKQELLDDPLLTLQRYLAYKCPWSINLDIKEAPPGFGWHSDSGTWHLPKNSMTFGMPDQPRVEQESIALAAYNDAGPTYLFSCC